MVDDDLEALHSSEEEEEEEEEENVKRAKKRSRSKKKPKFSLIDEEAGEEEDDEEDEYDELRREEERKGNRTAHNIMRQQDERRKREPTFRPDDSVSLAEQARAIQARFGNASQSTRSSETSRAGGATVEAARFVRNQPTAKHPKLFAIACKTGEENAIVVKMYQKYIRDKTKRPTPVSSQPQFQSRFTKAIAAGAELEIFSIVAPGTSGVIYVEAMKQDAVLAASQGIEGIYRSKISIIKVEEMTDVLRVDIRKEVVRKGDFVRMRGPFPYKGDLAQVFSVLDAGSKVTVKVLPRIDFSKIEQSSSLRASGKAVRPSAANGPAPPAKFFIPDEIRAAGGVVIRDTSQLTGEIMDVFNNQSFEGGLLFLELSIRQVSQLTASSQYTAEEVSVFSNDKEGKNALDAMAEQTKRKTGRVGAVSALPVNIVITDRCHVVSGPDAGLEGVVESVNLVMQTALLRVANLKLAVDVRLRDLVKSFKVGDYVAVISGTDVGKTGNVVQVFQDKTTRPRVLILTNGQEELQIFNADLKISNDATAIVGGSQASSANGQTLGGYALYDLVQLDQNLHAIVTRVGAHTLRIMTHSGEVKEINPSAVRAKKNQMSKDAVASDKSNQPIRVNDPVQVMTGPHAGVTGSVKQLYAATVFVHNPRREENAGVMAVKAKDCKLASGLVKPLGQRDNAGTKSQYAPRTHRDELLGKMVRIRKGDEKGLVGTVVDGGSIDNVRVELNARNKVIAVPRENIVVIEPEIRHQPLEYQYVPEDMASSYQAAPPTPGSSYNYDYGGGAAAGSPNVFSPPPTGAAESFKQGDSVKLVDSGESVTVYSIVDAKELVVTTVKGDYKIVSASNLVFA
ncbi:hypothetical protein BASA81_003919 [Batrachochytrium salamandrivorans]|nr:hypothetical protein BASA81_003919 [Batrachochytrium salamandrivorans]